MLDKFISDVQLDQIVQGLIRRDYDLLLGAGASIDAIGGDGRPLPDGKTLSRDLLQAFDVKVKDNNVDLKLAYEVIGSGKNKDGKSIWDYFFQRFTNCKPNWQRLLCEFDWNRIWTLNIDDVIERAYEITDHSNQKPNSISWRSPYREPDRSLNELQIVHLHGKAGKPDNAESDIIFSIIEYLQATSAQHVWHRIFGDEFLQRPFIIVGASLADEYDLADILRRGNHSLKTFGRPSVIILKSVDEIRRRLFQKWGLILVESDAATFFKDLFKKIPEQERKAVKAFLNIKTENLPKQAKVFLQQFNNLRLDAKPVTQESHDFYSGDEPYWDDILQDHDAKFEIVEKVLSNYMQSNSIQTNKQRQSLDIIFGPAGSGKSTALLRIGREFLRMGYDVFTFRGEEQIEISAVEWWLRHTKRTILLFDGVADFAHDIKRLLLECDKKDTTCLIVACERQNRADYVFNIIPAEYFGNANKHIFDKLTNSDINSLIDVLEKAKRLGKLTRSAYEDKKKYFRTTAKRQLLTAMAELEGGKGHVDRIYAEYESIKDSTLQDLYAMSCMTYSFGYPLPLGIAISASGVDTESLNQALSYKGTFSGILRRSRLGLHPRHRVIANILIAKMLKVNKNFQLSLTLAKTIAPHVNIQTLKQETLPSRIAKILMDSEVVYGWMGQKLASRWYDELHDNFSWNSKFWEQRALTEARLKYFPKARSFAEEAVRIYYHHYSLNTLGTILVRMALEYVSPNSSESEELFWEGVKKLQESAKLSSFESTHPFITFFTYAWHYVRRDRSTLYTGSRIAKEWNSWMTRARNVPAFKHAELQFELENFQKQWLLLVTKD